MRVWDFAARFGLCAISAMMMSVGTGYAQDILPSSVFGVADGDWNTGGNWNNGVPADDVIAAVNGGTARVTSSVPAIETLGVRGGGVVSVEAGGDLSVGGDAIIGPGGTLRYSGGTLTAGTLAFTGDLSLDAAVAGPISLGTSWQVANSTNILGSPGSISLDGGTLDRGMAFRFGTNDTGATVTVSNEPILVIDRATGNAAIENVVGGAIDLKGYTITGTTIGEGWNSFADQATAGWSEANVSETRFTEYNLTGSSSMASGSSMGIGTLLDSFGPPITEDVAFEYILADGTVSSGLVEYAGPINDLVLFVDPETGAGTISHQAVPLPDFEVIGYTISSASGSLNAGDGYTGIGGADWSIANPQTTALTEVNLEGSTVFSAGTEVSLGTIFTGGEQDLVFQFALSNEEIVTGTVSYGAPMTGGGCEPINSLLGDLDGNGSVAFADFLILSGNFGQSVGSYEEGDIDCNGEVAFADFLTLSGNFGQSLGGAQSVPEPTGGMLTALGMLGGMFMLRRRRKALLTATAVVATALLMVPQSAQAELDARFIRLHPDSPNNGLNSITEAIGILNGSVFDIIVNEDITGTYDVVDLAGGAGTFTVNNAYLNGVTDASMSNFMNYLSGEVSFAAGEYTIGCGSDDGCLIHMPGISFETTLNENGFTIEGDGQLLFDPGRGHDWTFGTFTVPEGGITTSFEAISNEGGGGDSFEIAITDFAIDPEVDTLGTIEERATFVDENFLEFEDGAVSGLQVSPGAFVPPVTVPGDFNGDGSVTIVDANILQDNIFAAGGIANGDITGNGFVDFDDLAAFAPIFEAASAAASAQSVPEPNAALLSIFGMLGLLAIRRRR